MLAPDGAQPVADLPERGLGLHGLDDGRHDVVRGARDGLQSVERAQAIGCRILGLVMTGTRADMPAWMGRMTGARADA